MNGQTPVLNDDQLYLDVAKRENLNGFFEFGDFSPCLDDRRLGPSLTDYATTHFGSPFWHCLAEKVSPFFKILIKISNRSEIVL